MQNSPLIPRPDIALETYKWRMDKLKKESEAKAMWDKERRTVNLQAYNQSLTKRLDELMEKKTKEETQKKDLEWYQDFKEQCRAEWHLDDDNRLMAKTPHNRRTIRYT